MHVAVGFQPNARRHFVEAVEVRFEPGTPVIVSDYVKLRQILVNFVSNAAKFTTSGTITLRASGDDERVSLSVADTGIGIREEDLAKLFVAFGQLEEATTRRFDGTGLGLTITRQLTELLGGTVQVVSVYGQGSTFSVALPRRPQPKERPR